MKKRMNERVRRLLSAEGGHIVNDDDRASQGFDPERMYNDG
jgi:hypothetical protein